MTTEEWLAKVRASRPPLTQAQIATLRAVLQPVLPQIRTTASRRAEAAPARAVTEPQAENPTGSSKVRERGSPPPSE